MRGDSGENRFGIISGGNGAFVARSFILRRPTARRISTRRVERFISREQNGNVWTMLARRSAIGKQRVGRQQIAPKRSSRFFFSDRALPSAPRHPFSAGRIRLFLDKLAIPLHLAFTLRTIFLGRRFCKWKFEMRRIERWWRLVSSMRYCLAGR